MKICLKENEFNPSFISIFGEEKAREQGYHIVEIDNQYADCVFEDFINFEFNSNKYNARKQRETNQIELIKLKNWFDDYFDKQMFQSTWQTNFVISVDPYFKDEIGNALTYSNINELKAQAEIVRARIKEIK